MIGMKLDNVRNATNWLENFINQGKCRFGSMSGYFQGRKARACEIMIARGKKGETIRPLLYMEVSTDRIKNGYPKIRKDMFVNIQETESEYYIVVALSDESVKAIKLINTNGLFQLLLNIGKIHTEINPYGMFQEIVFAFPHD